MIATDQTTILEIKETIPHDAVLINFVREMLAKKYQKV